MVALAAGTGGCGNSHASSPAERADAYRHTLHRGERLGELRVPRLHVSVPIYVGFDQQILTRGPGWYPGSHLPGEHHLMYVAGHRRTHGGPFRWAGRLRPGDRVVISVPYGTATYSVTHHEFVLESHTQILRGPPRDELRLQSSTIPPGHTRLVVFATLVSLEDAG